MQNTNTNNTVLSLRPGSRHMGVAVFEGTELIFWGVTGFRGVAPHRVVAAVESRLRNWIELYEPTVIAIENPGTTRLNASPLLRDIVVRISAVTLDESLYYQLYGLPTIKERLCYSAKATRKDMIAHVVKLYPHLERYAKGGSAWRKAYWLPMFAAVSVGLICTKK